MAMTHIGADIAKAKFDVAFKDGKGKYRHKRFDNTQEGFAAFLPWLESHGVANPWVCMEATGAYSIPLAEFLIGQNLPVSVVNPAKIHAFAKSELSRAKTDKVDAKLIALWASRQGEDLSPWSPPPPKVRELQALLRRVEDLLEMQQMERNRLDTANAAVVDSVKTLLALLGKELDATRKAIRRLVNDDPDLRRRATLLESIPGVGPATTAWLLVALSEHYDFKHAKQAVAHAGLAPRLRESGTWKGHTRLSKTGDPLLRKVLYMSAMSASTHNPALRAFSQRLRANGKNGLATLCAVMRKMIHIAFAVLKTGQKFDPKHALA